MFNRTKAKRDERGQLTEEALRAWLVDYLADKLSVSPSQVDTSREFEDYGLDSRAGIQLSGKLEKLVEHRLSPALLYEYQSIDVLVDYLLKEPE
ncbi:acyl carrier protein [Saccharopolyspora hattusasensis]|uniref:acyl carrier protein n=1 Tax=Saccharopolyspora hattusasensis TaxID=1128679 RepID=UPI003D97AAD0